MIATCVVEAWVIENPFIDMVSSLGNNISSLRLEIYSSVQKSALAGKAPVIRGEIPKTQTEIPKQIFPKNSSAQDLNF